MSAAGILFDQVDGSEIWSATIDRSLWSYAGVHGGILASVALGTVEGVRAVAVGTAQPVRSLTTHFLAPVNERPLLIAPSVQRAARGSAVLTYTATQGDDTVLLGSAVFGAARRGPELAGTAAPSVPAPADCPEITLPPELALYARTLEIRPATDARPLSGGSSAELTAWVRFRDGRPLDAASVLVLADALPPALYAVRTEPVPIPSVDLTIHFSDALDDAPAAEWGLIRVTARHAGNGWAVDDSTVWAADGRLLALARQSRRVLLR